eukprot:CAMPEP_0177497522 /NCGR_PEP_ID=MMETSP0369-20130122/35091_1 /TAXON_ID=447022 ORGANISM="Scrippsiella hangoei-like, Strain SHHI-4" /NCGR_SAMPLE_ID=MMETSP0369 /ASSEMBLY_ACC=CAM_ASM_000364 /LENGTH=464 /DNA_ID=CAMNT_0018974677 /DNA_START=9 /DNA_END=1403 /DNA_ORIENTATION=-
MQPFESDASGLGMGPRPSSPTGRTPPSPKSFGRPGGFQRDTDAFSDAIDAASTVLGTAFQKATGVLGGVSGSLGLFGGLKQKYSCCCSAEGAEARARGEAQDGGMGGYVYNEEPLLVSQPVFPTILKPQQEGSSKLLSPTNGGHSSVPGSAFETAPLVQDVHLNGAMAATPTSSYGSRTPVGRVQWAPGGVLASLMNSGVGGEQEDLVECPEMEIENGARYVGQWLGDERHGRGILVTRDGLRYEGHFKHNMAHGRGLFIEADGSRYEGQWDQDTKQGHGVYTHIDGTTFEGQWRKDVKSGTGTEVWADGALYQGEFFNGFKHGVGIYRGNGGVEYEGQFREDKMHGEGCYKFAGGRKYFGQWADGHMTGAGRMEWPNGAVYDGGYLNDLKSGEGSFLWPDGRTYSGGWLNGKQHGEGISEDAKGFKTQDVWNHGELVSSEDLPSKRDLSAVHEEEEVWDDDGP